MPDITDRDRQRVADALRAHFTAGRIDVEEFDSRLGAAWAAQTQGDLDALVADLPRLTDAAVAPGPGEGRAPGRAPWPGRAPASTWEDARRGWAMRSAHAHMRSFLTTMAILVAIWALTGFGYFWPAWPMVIWGIFVFRHAMWARRYDGSRGRHQHHGYACGPASRIF